METSEETQGAAQKQPFILKSWSLAEKKQTFCESTALRMSTAILIINYIS